MKPKFEKNIFIKRIINTDKFPKRKLISNSNIISSTINNNSHRINPKQCYIKPHPIFIISNLSKKNKFEINIHPKKEKNFIYIKSKNFYNTERYKLNYEDEYNTSRSKSFDVVPFEHMDKINNKNKYNKNCLNSFDNNKSLRNDTSSDNNYFIKKYNTINNIENNNIKYKSSKSKDIIKLCKVLKNLYNKNNNEIIFKEKRNIMNINEDIVKQIILIQKWWKEMIYKKYLKKKIIRMQKMFRGYIFRKKFYQILCLLQKFSNYEYLDKIIFIQRFWKNYLMNNNLISMSFSFTNNEDNNNTNHKDIIYIDNNNSNNKNDLNNSSDKKNNPNSIKNKIILKSCFYTKKYYLNIASIFSDIILIQRSFKKYLVNKNKNNIIKNNQQIYHKKSLKKQKTKSRNKNEIIDKTNIKKKDIFKSLIIVSSEREIREIQYHTPKKEKINKIKFDEIITRNTNNECIFHRQINNICLISKINKDINIDTKVKFLQNKIIYFLRNGKRKYNIKGIIKDINNICFIEKIYGNNIIGNKLKNIINILQINIKKFLRRINNEINSPIANKLKTIKINKINLSKEIFQSTNDNSINNNISIIQNNINKISEFTPDEINNKNNKNENIFISNNLNTFSFDFKNIKNEDIEDDDNINMISPKNISTNKTINFSCKNMLISTERYYSYKKLKKIFISNISNKFANFLMNILHKLHLYNFIKLFLQKINKSINQYIYFSLFNKKNEKNDIIFFTTLKRHIFYNMQMDNNNNNEIKKLLIENIPKSFQSYNDELCLINIPYINSFQEKNLINCQLFFDNDGNLVNYFVNFYKNDFLQINHTLLKNILNKYKLNNRNIFTLTKYFDDIIELIKDNKLCSKCLCLNINCLCKKNNNNKSNNFNYIKKRCNYISKLYKKKIEKEKEVNINNEFFKMIDEEEAYSYDDELDENENNKNINKSLNHSYIINMRKNNLLTYHNDNIQDNHEYKFFDYLNEKSKNNKYNETLPISYRENHNLIKI